MPRLRVKRLPGRGLHQGAQDGHQPPAPGVDHARPAEDGELFRGPYEGGQRPVVGGGDHGPQARARVAGGVGGGRRDGEDRTVDGVGDGLPGGVGGAREGEAQPVRPAPVGEHPGHAAQQLGQDRAGVAARADQGSVRHGAYGVGGGGCGGPGLVGGEDGFDGGGRGLEGQIEVGAGVTVRDGIDVDRVDLRALPPEGLQGQ